MENNSEKSNHTNFKRIITIAYTPVIILLLLNAYLPAVFNVISYIFDWYISAITAFLKSSKLFLEILLGNIRVTNPQLSFLEIMEPVFNNFNKLTIVVTNLSIVELTCLAFIMIAIAIVCLLHLETPEDENHKVNQTSSKENSADEIDYSGSREVLENHLQSYKFKKDMLDIKLQVTRNKIYQERTSRVFFGPDDYTTRQKWKNGYYRETKSTLNFLIASFGLCIVFNTIAIYTYFDSFLTMTPDTSPLLCHLAGFLTCLTIWAFIYTNIYYEKEKTELGSISLESFLAREYKFYADTIKELQAKASGIRAKLKANDEVISKLKAEIIKRNDAILND
jgi:heme/copper-type cytochrome/quinol oxidase subunit 4